MSAEHDLDQYYEVVLSLVEQAGRVSWRNGINRYTCGNIKCVCFFFVKIIASRNDQRKSVVTKSCDVDLLTETDQEVEKLLMDNLSRQFPEHR